MGATRTPGYETKAATDKTPMMQQGAHHERCMRLANGNTGVTPNAKGYEGHSLSSLMSRDAATPNNQVNMQTIMSQLDCWTKINREVSMPITKSRSMHTTEGEFELVSAIVDSGATTPVMHPVSGKCYEMMESGVAIEDMSTRLHAETS